MSSHVRARRLARFQPGTTPQTALGFGIKKQDQDEGGHFKTIKQEALEGPFVTVIDLEAESRVPSLAPTIVEDESTPVSSQEGVNHSFIAESERSPSPPGSQKRQASEEPGPSSPAKRPDIKPEPTTLENTPEPAEHPVFKLEDTPEPVTPQAVKAEGSPEPIPWDAPDVEPIDYTVAAEIMEEDKEILFKDPNYEHAQQQWIEDYLIELRLWALIRPIEKVKLDARNDIFQQITGIEAMSRYELHRFELRKCLPGRAFRNTRDMSGIAYCHDDVKELAHMKVAMCNGLHIDNKDRQGMLEMGKVMLDQRHAKWCTRRDHHNCFSHFLRTNKKGIDEACYSPLGTRSMRRK